MPSAPFTRDDGGPIPAHWNLQCLQCGYELTGLTARTCPECGRPFSVRETFEANRDGVIPESERDYSYLISHGIAGFIVVGLAAFGLLAGRPSAVAAAVVIFGGELWIVLSSVPPMVVRIMVASVCVLIAMIVLL